MKKNLLLMDPAPTSMTYKLLYYLKDYFDITLISLSVKYNEKMYRDLGIKVHSFNFQGERYWRDKKYINGLKESAKFIFKFLWLWLKKYDYVLARTEPNMVGYFLFKAFIKPKKIYFPYDITFFRYKHPERRRSEFSKKVERYCYENADYIIHKGPENELNLLRKDEVGKIKGKQIQFLPYCFEPWMIPVKSEKEKPKNISLVYAGGLFYNYKGASERLAPDPRYKIQWYEIFRELSKQKINIDAWSLDPVKDISDKYIKMHFEPMKNITEDSSKFHYGIHIFFHNMEDLDERWLKTSVCNKFFSYLEAGIPIIINDEIEFIANLVKKYKIGIVINEKDLPNLKKIIEKQDYKKMLKNIEKARKEFSMKPQIKRLVKELAG